MKNPLRKKLTRQRPLGLDTDFIDGYVPMIDCDGGEHYLIGNTWTEVSITEGRRARNRKMLADSQPGPDAQLAYDGLRESHDLRNRPTVFYGQEVRDDLAMLYDEADVIEFLQRRFGER